MIFQPQAEPAPRRVRTGIAARAVTTAGVLIALIALLATSWYTVTGPNVVRPGHLAANRGGDVLLVDPDLGSRHSSLVWLIFCCCVIAAVAAGLPAAGGPAVGRVAAPILAAVLIVLAIARVDRRRGRDHAAFT